VPARQNLRNPDFRACVAHTAIIFSPHLRRTGSRQSAAVSFSKKARKIMINLRNTTAILALATGLTALPLIAGAQILGGSGQAGGAIGGVTGQVQGGVTGQVGVGGVQDTLGNATQQVDDAASRPQSNVDTARQQTEDTTRQVQGAAKVDGTVEAKGDASGADASGNVGATVDPNAVTGAAASGVNNAKSDVNTVAGQAGDTVKGATNAASTADLNAEARADAEAKADVEKK
jgi:hypothetical protein